MSELCGEWTGKNVDLLTGEVRAGAIWCKSWLCEYCAPIRSKQLQAQAAAGSPDKFITLTSLNRSDEMSPDAAARELVHAWRMVVQRGKREGIFKDIQYIAVFELTEEGWPHLHLLARCPFIPQKWLSDRMAEYALSPIVDIRKVKGKKRAAWYIAKYTSKAPEKFRGCKRYWRTLRYDLSGKTRDRPVADHRRGFLDTHHVSVLAEMYQMHGYDLEWDGEHSFSAFPTDTDFYEPARRAWAIAQARPYRESKQCSLN